MYYYAHALLAAAGRSRDGGREVLGCNWGYRNTSLHEGARAHYWYAGGRAVRADAEAAARRRYACTRVRAPGLRGRSRTFLPPALSALQAGGLRGVPAARCALLVLGHVLFTVLSRLAGRVVLSTK